MKKSFIIGRKSEIALLKDCHKTAKSEFVVVYGRRRVGKTFLVNECLSRAQCYMAMGGIPFYLDNIPTTVNSFPAAIDEMFFREGGVLREEYPNLYKSLFSNSTVYEKIVRLLAKSKQGLSKQDIVKSLKLPNGGTTNEYLDNLERCGFIRTYNAYGNKSRNKTYKLIDFYTLFYLQFVYDDISGGGAHRQTMIDSPSRRAWSGYAFEILCLTHVDKIRAALGFSAVNCTMSSWRAGATEERDGAQIDLVIDRRDQIINLCEMKFSTAKYAINADYEENLRNKINAFRIENKVTSALHLMMITTYGVKQNSHSGIVTSEVMLEDLFK